MTTRIQQDVHDRRVERTQPGQLFRLNEVHFLALAYGLTGLAWIGAAVGIGLLATLGVWLLAG